MAFAGMHLGEVVEVFDIEGCRHCSCFEDDIAVADLLVLKDSLVESMVVGDIVVVVVVAVGLYVDCKVAGNIVVELNLAVFD
jgi:hypothetical protein